MPPAPRLLRLGALLPVLPLASLAAFLACTKDIVLPDRQVAPVCGNGIIEGIESTTPGEFLVGVQWHPEMGTDPRLFRALVAAARAV